MQALSRCNHGYKYILTVIDVFSKVAYVRPLKNKTGIHVAETMESILENIDAPVRNVQTDEGTEFYNKSFKNVMKKFNINHYSTHSIVKVCLFLLFPGKQPHKLFSLFYSVQFVKDSIEHLNQ